MNDTFNKMHGQLGRAVIWVLYGALATFGLALIGALLGLPQMVVSFRGAAASLGIVFVGLFALFVVSALTSAVLRRVRSDA